MGLTPTVTSARKSKWFKWGSAAMIVDKRLIGIARELNRR